MSDAKIEEAAPGAEATEASASGAVQAGTPAAAARPNALQLPLMLLLAAGALAGGAVLGLFVVGPQVVAARAHAPIAAVAQQAGAQEAPQEAPSHGGKNGKGDAAKVKPTLYKVDNIIVNPAGAQGSHFLMASVVFEVPEDKVEERLRDREAQVRDVVVSALESKSMDDLIRPGARDRLKLELAAAIKPIAGNPAWIHVYLPQFVIQ